VKRFLSTATGKAVHHPARCDRPQGHAAHPRSCATAHCGIHRVSRALPERQLRGRRLAGEYSCQADRMIVWWTRRNDARCSTRTQKEGPRSLNGRIFPHTFGVAGFEWRTQDAGTLAENTAGRASTKLTVAPSGTFRRWTRLHGHHAAPGQCFGGAIPAWERGF